MKFKLSNNVAEKELLYRVIRPFPEHWNFEENRLSSGAFKSSEPISVDRDGMREELDIIAFFWNFHPTNFGVVKISALHCRECETLVTASPIKENKSKAIKPNPYHAEINGNGVVGTKGSHGKCLNKKAVVIKYPNI